MKFEVGKTYKTKSGKSVRIVSESTITGYECVCGDDGFWRYNREDGKGRVTGTNHDMSHPDNLIVESDQMKIQILFDRVWDHFISNNRPVVSPKYRNGNNRCAIGIFIKDSEYNVSMEGVPVSHIKDAISEFNGVSPEFINDLQVAHDNVWLKDSKLENGLLKIASKYNLKTK